MICFEHIPKTAGKSLNLAFQSIYGSEYLNIKKDKVYPLKAFEGKSFISGHRSIRTLSINNIVPKQKITYLRHPRELLSSTYTHLLRSLTNVTNIQARMLMHGPRFLLERRDYRIFDNGVIRRILNYNGPVGSISDTHYKQCIDELENYDFIGFQEEFLKSLYSLSKVLSWDKLPVIVKFNELPKSQSVMSTYSSDEDYLLNLNSWDIKLYDYFKEKFDNLETAADFQVWNQIATLDAGVLQTLNTAFKQDNRKTKIRKLIGM